MSTQSDERSPDDIATDGRTARRDRNRVAVLDAVYELFSEGHLQPSVNEVADRSGVSLRSVYRYFDDGDDLIRAAIARVVERVWHLYKFDGLAEGSFEDRVDTIVSSRLALYEAIAPAARAANQRVPFEPILADERANRRASLRSQVARHFSVELDAMPSPKRERRLSAVDVLLHFESLELLHEQHDDDDIAVVLTDTIRLLLT